MRLLRGPLPGWATISVFLLGRTCPDFYWEDLPGRRLRPDLVTSAVALEQAKAVATAEREKLLS